MATETISRKELAGLVRRIHEKTLSGVIIAQTDSKRTIVLGFASGKLVRVKARGNSSLEDAIDLLQQSDEFKYNFTAMHVNSEPELMAVPDFAELLQQGSEDQTTIKNLRQAESSGAGSNINHEAFNALLLQLAAAEIGPMASMVLDQALEDGHSPGEIINLVAEQIPDYDAAQKFRQLANEGLKEVM